MDASRRPLPTLFKCVRRVTDTLSCEAQMSSYRTIHWFSVDEILPLIDGTKDRHTWNGKSFNVSSQRLCLFKKSLVCVTCRRKGAAFGLEQSQNPNPRQEGRFDYHVNLYTSDGVLMTKDHIIPKSRGGRNVMENYQTMCAPCNMKKGDNLPFDEAIKPPSLMVKRDAGRSSSGSQICQV